MRDTFLQSYAQAAVAGRLYAEQRDVEAALPLLELFVLQKALYELRYEMDNRPDVVAVLLAALAALAGMT